MIIKTLEPLSEINLKKIEDATGIKPEYVSREILVMKHLVVLTLLLQGIEILKVKYWKNAII